MSLSAEASRKYGFDASGAARITARIESLPPPMLLLQYLGASQNLIDEIERRNPVSGLPPKPREEVSAEDEPWVEFGRRWMAALDPIHAEIEELKQSLIEQGTPQHQEEASVLSTLQVVLARFPDSEENVSTMREFLARDEVIEMLKGPNDYQVEIDVTAALLPVLETAP